MHCKNTCLGEETQEVNPTKYRDELSSNGDIPDDCQQLVVVNTLFFIYKCIHLSDFTGTECYLKKTKQNKTKAMNELKTFLELPSPFRGPFF